MRRPQRSEHPDEGRGHEEGHELQPRDREFVDALVGEQTLQHHAEDGSQTDSHHGSEQGDDDRLQGDHPAHLRAGEGDGTQQAQFPGALDDAQTQGVDDAEHGDDDAESQQCVEQCHGPVDVDEDLVGVLANAASRALWACSWSVPGLR